MNITKKQVYIFLGLAIATTAAVHIAVRRKKNSKKIAFINGVLDGTTVDPANPKGTGQVEIPAQQVAAMPAGNFPLKIGDKNKKVYDLQVIMNRVYGSNLDLDGKFGQGTYSVLCDKYWTGWNTCWGSIGYKKTINQKDFDAIKATART